MAERRPPRSPIEGDPSLTPYANPVDRYAHLPERTRRFFESLDEQDIEALVDLLVSYERAKTIGWFVKWLFISMVGAFMGAVAFGEALSKVFSWVASAMGGR